MHRLLLDPGRDGLERVRLGDVAGPVRFGGPRREDIPVPDRNLCGNPAFFFHAQGGRGETRWQAVGAAYPVNNDQVAQPGIEPEVVVGRRLDLDSALRGQVLGGLVHPVGQAAHVKQLPAAERPQVQQARAAVAVDAQLVAARVLAQVELVSRVPHGGGACCKQLGHRLFCPVHHQRRVQLRPQALDRHGGGRALRMADCRFDDGPPGGRHTGVEPARHAADAMAPAGAFAPALHIATLQRRAGRRFTSADGGGIGDARDLACTGAAQAGAQLAIGIVAPAGHGAVHQQGAGVAVSYRYGLGRGGKACHFYREDPPGAACGHAQFAMQVAAPAGHFAARTQHAGMAVEERNLQRIGDAGQGARQAGGHASLHQAAAGTHANHRAFLPHRAGAAIACRHVLDPRQPFDLDGLRRRHHVRLAELPLAGIAPALDVGVNQRAGMRCADGDLGGVDIGDASLGRELSLLQEIIVPPAPHVVAR